MDLIYGVLGSYEVELLPGFDALDDDTQPKIRAQPRDAAQQGTLMLVVAQVLEERLIDLQVVTAKAMEDYLDAYVAGWSIPERDHAQFKSNVRPWLEQAGWALYLARVNGRPAAAATLYVHDRVGYLADSATDPSYRGRGLQLALLRRRMRDAGVSEVDFVFSGAEPFSSSHRNMERAGMRLQFVRAKWTPAT